MGSIDLFERQSDPEAGRHKHFFFFCHLLVPSAKVHNSQVKDEIDSQPASCTLGTQVLGHDLPPARGINRKLDEELGSLHGGSPPPMVHLLPLSPKLFILVIHSVFPTP